MVVVQQNLIQFDATKGQLICSGEWDINHVTALKKSLKQISWPTNRKLYINGKAITKMDSAGAWLLSQQFDHLKKRGLDIQLDDFSPAHQKLFSLIEKQHASITKIPKAEKISFLAHLGQYTTVLAKEFTEYTSFIGKLTMEALRLSIHPKHIRWNALSNVLDTTGVQALPIIALLSFMIGIVLAYQMGNQLRPYGANVFIVNLLGLSILREFGPLITAIMVAGRTGSSFTAQLGIMKINQEIDALDTMGVTPAEILILPRIVGLFIALPLLTMWADIFGIFGGMIMANNMLGIGWHDFLNRFQQEIPLKSLMIGLGKAPVFALVISSIGCFQGMLVKSTADSLGKNTTRSVVLGIFFIIVIDAIFSIIFSKLKL